MALPTLATLADYLLLELQHVSIQGKLVQARLGWRWAQRYRYRAVKDLADSCRTHAREAVEYEGQPFRLCEGGGRGHLKVQVRGIRIARLPGSTQHGTSPYPLPYLDSQATRQQVGILYKDVGGATSSTTKLPISPRTVRAVGAGS